MLGMSWLSQIKAKMAGGRCNVMVILGCFQVPTWKKYDHCTWRSDNMYFNMDSLPFRHFELPCLVFIEVRVCRILKIMF